ncbi:MAG TPA: tetratricopeptide repeat protein [Actinobacteria bacterium]|nr:tetratricopeptide repeat protein [Actinomycetes bacterium]HEX21782.1 tetratricopeptide repeat protein [Actinomycetota bacterium]
MNLSETNNIKESRFERRERELLKQEARLNFWVRIAGMLVILTIFGSVGYGLYYYAQLHNQPPRSYNDLQLRTWQTQVSKNPKNPEAHVNMGAVYYRIGNLDRALREFNITLSLDKKNADAYLYRGRIYKKRGEVKKAIADFRSSIKYSRKETRLFPLFELGDLYEKQKKYKLAIKTYESLITENPIFWNAHYQLAINLEKTGDKKRALSEYQEAAKFNPKNRKLQKAIKRLSPLEVK